MCVMQQQNGVYDLLKMLEISLEEGFPIIPRKFTVVKTKEIEALIDRIYASLPLEVQEAKALLRRREELQIEAQQKQKKLLTMLKQKLIESCQKLILLKHWNVKVLELELKFSKNAKKSNAKQWKKLKTLELKQLMMQ